MDLILQPLTTDHQPLVWRMLMHAAHEPTIEAVKHQPALARYAADWGRRGDLGVVALVPGHAVGAAWLRVWTAADHGFGYVNDATPELVLAVLPTYRGNGVGTRLLMTVLHMAAQQFAAVSLNVRATNPVVRLYERAGFRKVDGSELINRTGGVSFTMLKPLRR